jgi:methyltransferase FkbM-like protein
MLEPQPGPAAQVRELYKDNVNIVVIEAAVDSKRMTRTLYTVERNALPKWVGGMASFEREQILKQSYLIPGIENLIRELSVECIPFSDILELRPSNGRLDLLQIDAEGADGRTVGRSPAPGRQTDDILRRHGFEPANFERPPVLD